MKQVFLKSIIAIAFFFTISNSNASHLIGGEINYECIGNNQYEITMTLYRDCYSSSGSGGATTPFDQLAQMSIFTGNGTNYNNFSASYDQTIYPQTLSSTIPNGCLVPAIPLCVDKATYVTIINLPYDSTGYHITYQRCCRSASLLNIANPGQSGMTLTTFVSDQAQISCNDSPDFDSDPLVLSCVNNSMIIDASATDANGDSLVYSLCAPLIGASPTAPQPNIASPPPYANANYFGSFFTASQPLIGTISMNTQTGIITSVPTATGFYTIGVCVDEYKNGVWIGSNSRDFTIGIVDCNSYLSGEIVADSIDQAGNFVINSCLPTIDFLVPNTLLQVIDSLKWTFALSPGNIMTSNSTNPQVTFPGLGSYTGQLIASADTLNCIDTIKILVNIVTDTSLHIDFTHTYDSTIIDPIDFQGTGMSNDSIIAWHWNFGDDTTSTLQNPTYQYQDSGTYLVTLTVTTIKGCSEQVSKWVEWMPIPILLSADQSSLTEKVNLFPNPASEMIHLQIDNPSNNRGYNIIIYNSIGQAVIVKQDLYLDQNNSILINTKQLTAGQYFVKVENGAASKMLKLVIQN